VKAPVRQITKTDFAPIKYICSKILEMFAGRENMFKNPLVRNKAILPVSCIPKITHLPIVEKGLFDIAFWSITGLTLF